MQGCFKLSQHPLSVLVVAPCPRRPGWEPIQRCRKNACTLPNNRWHHYLLARPPHLVWSSTQWIPDTHANGKTSSSKLHLFDQACSGQACWAPSPRWCMCDCCKPAHSTFVHHPQEGGSLKVSLPTQPKRHTRKQNMLQCSTLRSNGQYHLLPCRCASNLCHLRFASVDYLTVSH